MKPILIKTKIFYDNRGFFKELWLKKNIKFSCKFTAMSKSKGMYRSITALANEFYRQYKSTN